MMWYLLTIIYFIQLSDGLLLRQPLNLTVYAPTQFKNVGEPLFLTPLLEQGRIQQAQQLSAVHLENFKDMKSYSGYLTVNKSCESSLFFWFFLAQEAWGEAPVVLWLQGGPGVTSMFGLLKELGPITSEGKRREISWNSKTNLLFIDQPVGTGFSFSRKRCFSKNEVDVQNYLYSALVQFFQMFPSLQKNRFFITGESYAGHYVPSIAYAIHKNNQKSEIKINLTGLMIGNGIMDVLYQSGYGKYLYQLGLVDDKQRYIIDVHQKEMVKYLKKEDWQRARVAFSAQQNSISDFIGNVSIFNYHHAKMDIYNELKPLERFMSSQEHRKALHVGNKAFSSFNELVNIVLDIDIIQSVKPLVEELLEHYPVVFYHGQLDIICAYPLAVNLLRKLSWSGAQDYLRAERRQWCVQDQLAGYFKSGHNLHEVMVRAAGHTVPRDQPLWAFHLLDALTSGPPHNPLQQLNICPEKVKLSNNQSLYSL